MRLFQGLSTPFTLLTGVRQDYRRRIHVAWRRITVGDCARTLCGHAHVAQAQEAHCS